VVLAACGGTKTVTETVTVTRTVTTSGPVASALLHVYFLRGGELATAGRDVPREKLVAALLDGPTAAERGIGMTSAAPFSAFVSRDGAVRCGCSRPALAQLVYTLTQFPGVKTATVDGKQYSRADFEDLAPLILIESPTPFETVRSPLRVTGESNTFEASMVLEAQAKDGSKLGTQPVTATSGSGQRGTFDAVLGFLPHSGPGVIRGFEESAENGQRIHVYEVPVRFAP
jgi:germination protein M